MHDFKYGDLIAKIQRKKKWIIAITIVAVLLIIIFGSPTVVEVMGEPVIQSGGIPPVLAVILVLLCLFIEVFAISVVHLPLSTSLDQECDPEKQLILNMHLNKQKDIDHIFAGDYFYLGMYVESMNYAKKMVMSGKEPLVLSGLFCKARCEFFMGDYAAFCQTASDFSATLSTCKKLKPKERESYQKIEQIIKLMFAISNGDEKTVNELRNTVEAWRPSAAIDGYINYIKGLAATQIGDKDEAVYRFKSVKEHCSKTALAHLSDQHLAALSK